MKKFSPPQMKEVSFPTPHTPHPTPSFKSEIRQWHQFGRGLPWTTDKVVDDKDHY